MTDRTIAPPCPSCGAICVMVNPLPTDPTDEQIFGGRCERCAGVGAFNFPLHIAQSGKAIYAEKDKCPDCNGPPPHPTTFQPGDPNTGRACARCGYAIPAGCRYAHDEWCRTRTPGRVGGAENRWRCLGRTFILNADGTRTPEGGCRGRDDIVASDTLWAELVRWWRTRSKTTVVRDGDIRPDLTYLSPDGADVRRGPLTITVVWEPKEPA